MVRSTEVKPPGALSSQSESDRGLAPPKSPPLMAEASMSTYWVFSLRPVSVTLKRIWLPAKRFKLAPDARVNLSVAPSPTLKNRSVMVPPVWPRVRLFRALMSLPALSRRRREEPLPTFTLVMRAGLAIPPERLTLLPDPATLMANPGLVSNPAMLKLLAVPETLRPEVPLTSELITRLPASTDVVPL